MKDQRSDIKVHSSKIICQKSLVKDETLKVKDEKLKVMIQRNSKGFKARKLIVKNHESKMRD